METRLAEFKKIGAALINGFTVDEANEIAVLQLLDYFFAENPELSRGKGVALVGNYGAGKTSIFRIIQQMMEVRERFSMVRAMDIANDYAVHGESIVSKYKNDQVLMVDDVGEEEDKHRFGNKVNSVAEVMGVRYECHQDRGIVTHMSSNLNLDDFESRYSGRIASRMHEMFHVIRFTSTVDRRKSSAPVERRPKANFVKRTTTDLDKKKIADAFLEDVWFKPLEKYQKTGDIKVFQDYSMHEVFRELFKRGVIRLTEQQTQYYIEEGRSIYLLEPGNRHACRFPSLARKGSSHNFYRSVAERNSSSEGRAKYNAGLLFMWDYIHSMKNANP
ncbi:MAG: hypothetical protein MK081_14025 [Flavobacteriales bacterium]|nr:hypothetical protein [Flavobacteriales bacterium]